MVSLYNGKQCRYTRSLSMYYESVSGALHAVVSPSPDYPKAFADFSYSKDTLSAVTNLDRCPLWRNQSQSFAERATMTYAYLSGSFFFASIAWNNAIWDECVVEVVRHVMKWIDNRVDWKLSKKLSIVEPNETIVHDVNGDKFYYCWHTYIERQTKSDPCLILWRSL